jgi:hypothetical protein
LIFFATQIFPRVGNFPPTCLPIVPFWHSANSPAFFAANICLAKNALPTQQKLPAIYLPSV